MDPNLPQQTFTGVSGGGELSLYQYFTASPLFADFKDYDSPERKIFLSEYATMPQGLKNFMASTETATNITSVGLTYQLDDNQVSKIAASLRELILGKIFIKDFPITISSKLGIDDIKAGEITNRIVSTSFGPIIEDIKRIQRSKFPDKVMTMQKESQPAGLSPKPSVSEEVKSMPLTQPGARQDVPSVRPSITPQQAPIRPPVIQPPPVQQPKPEPVPNLPVQAPPMQTAPSRPEPPKPQFKMPDLGPLDMAQIKKPMQGAGSGNKDNTAQSSQKSLEEALEKVANVIDLREKSEQ